MFGENSVRWGRAGLWGVGGILFERNMAFLWESCLRGSRVSAGIVSEVGAGSVGGDGVSGGSRVYGRGSCLRWEQGLWEEILSEVTRRRLEGPVPRGWSLRWALAPCAGLLGPEVARPG